MILENLFNAETLYICYIIIGYFIVSLIIKILKFISKKTKTTIDDKIVDKLEKWHKINKDRIKR